MFNSKVFVAEMIGTFALVFMGAGAGIMGAGLVGIALAHALAITIFAYSYGYISGTHINPAVTYALLMNGNVKWDRAIGSYWIPQLLGAALAGTLLRALAGDISAGATVGSLTNAPYPGPLLGALTEAVLTFFLVNTVLHAAVAGKGGQFAGLAAGLTVGGAILAAGPLTGASLNPARTFGIALYSGPSLANPLTYLIYLLAPLIGATVALMAFTFLSGEQAEEAPRKRKAPTKKGAARK